MAKSKIFRNPQRKQNENFQPYKPQYVIRGVEPEKISSAVVPETVDARLINHAPTVSYDNPRTRHAPTVRNSPFAVPPSRPSPVGDGPLPNIGNNFQNTWIGVDGESFEDPSEDSEPMTISPEDIIDNNDDDPNNYADIPFEIKAPPQDFDLENQSKEEYDYVLLVNGTVISTGFAEEIQEEVRDLIYGEHPLCQEVHGSISPDDITLLKKVNIKVGVFIE